MATIPFPKPIPLPPLLATPNEPSYSQIFADTMGNMGTPDDGFDGILGQMVSLTNSAANVADLDPNDVSAVSSITGLLGTTPEGDLALSLQPPQAATDAALSDYGALSTPTVAPTGPAQPPSTAPPQVSTVSCGPFAAGTKVTVLPAMKVGGVVAVFNFDEEQRVTGDPQTIRANLNCGDPAIFSVRGVTKLTPNIGAGTNTIDTLWNLNVTPTKPGTFYCIVDDVNDSGTFSSTITLYFQVTIS